MRMRFLLFGALGILLLLFAGFFASAQVVSPPTVLKTAAATGCRSDTELQNDVAACKKNGLGYVKEYDSSKCAFIKCVVLTSPCQSEEDLASAAAACKEQGYSYTYAYSNNCRSVKCVVPEQTSGCPSAEQLEAAVIKCKELGYGFESYPEGQCKQIRCVESQIMPNCPSEDASDVLAICKEKGLGVRYYYDDNKCKRVECSDSQCPADSALQDQIEECKRQGRNIEYYYKENCKYATCIELTEKVECKKFTSGGCVIIKCSDGFSFNSCDYCPGLQGEVTTGGSDFGTQSQRVDSKEQKPPVVEGKGTESGGDKGRPDTGPGSEAFVDSVKACIEEMKSGSVKIDDEVTWGKCSEKFGDSKKLFLDLKECVKDLKEKSNQIDDEVTWSKCSEGYTGSAEALTKVKSCISGAQGKASIDDEVTWNTCTGGVADSAGALEKIRSCIKDVKSGVASIDDEVTWDKCKGILELSPQPDPPGFFMRLGRFFTGIFG